jgi:hypothetical protein
MKMRQVAGMFHPTFRDSAKRFAFSKFATTIVFDFRLARSDSSGHLGRYINILLNCFPGNCRIVPLLSPNR